MKFTFNRNLFILALLFVPFIEFSMEYSQSSFQPSFGISVNNDIIEENLTNNIKYRNLSGTRRAQYDRRWKKYSGEINGEGLNISRAKKLFNDLKNEFYTVTTVGGTSEEVAP